MNKNNYIFFIANPNQKTYSLLPVPYDFEKNHIKIHTLWLAAISRSKKHFKKSQNTITVKFIKKLISKITSYYKENHHRSIFDRKVTNPQEKILYSYEPNDNSKVIIYSKNILYFQIIKWVEPFSIKELFNFLPKELDIYHQCTYTLETNINNINLLDDNIGFVKITQKTPPTSPTRNSLKQKSLNNLLRKQQKMIEQLQLENQKLKVQIAYFQSQQSNFQQALTHHIQPTKATIIPTPTPAVIITTHNLFTPRQQQLKIHPNIPKPQPHTGVQSHTLHPRNSNLNYHRQAKRPRTGNRTSSSNKLPGDIKENRQPQYTHPGKNFSAHKTTFFYNPADSSLPIAMTPTDSLNKFLFCQQDTQFGLTPDNTQPQHSGF